MIWIAYILLALYGLSLVYITIFCLLQFHLLTFYLNGKKPVQPKSYDGISEDDYPMVTIQLPIFNERYVAERLIDNIVQMDWPMHRLQIQILDDSTDDTIELTKAKVDFYHKQDFDIQFIHRVDRTGYKAGALKEAMPEVKGEFVAIFDADFLPRPTFLQDAVPYFQDNQVAVVQTRWEHLNEDYNLLTRLQALQLNVHFTVEQEGRHLGGCFPQFNGTAGLWRKTAIEDAGGWEADTLTEDLDLSYRAQMKGWKVRFLEHIASPAELPVEMHGLKSQQFRWMKGGAENCVKLFPTILRSPILGFRQKLHAGVHLTASAVFGVILFAGILSVPAVWAMNVVQLPKEFFGFCLIGLFAIAAVYFSGNIIAPVNDRPKWQRILEFIWKFPIFLALSSGLSLHNSVAIWEGYSGKKSPFVRTPKFNIRTGKDAVAAANYRGKKLSWTAIMEGILALYFIFGLWYGYTTGSTVFMLFHLLLAVGFGAIFYFSVRDLSLTKVKKVKPPVAPIPLEKALK